MNPPKTPSVEPIQESRLLPQISSRSLFLATAVVAVLAAVARASGNGGIVAAGAVVAMLFLASCLVVFVFLFLFAWTISVISPGQTEDVVQGNPFSQGQLPPQILPPRDPTPLK